MESGGSIERRGRTLENEFFHRVDERLIEELRAKLAAEQRSKALGRACGITDEGLLADLANAGVSLESLSALMIIPIVQVAWADRRVERKEAETTLQAAEAEGCEPGSASYQLLKSWLQNPPNPSLFVAWREYLESVLAKLDGPQRVALRDRVVGRASAVAKAAGGVLGVMSVSAAEQQVLDEIASAFGS